jgi:hypothetical protein
MVNNRIIIDTFWLVIMTIRMYLLWNMITFITRLNHCAIVMRSYAVMAVNRNGFFLFERVLFLAPIKFTYYAELGVVRARKSRNTIYVITYRTGRVHVTKFVWNYTTLTTRWNRGCHTAYGWGQILTHDGIIFHETSRKTSNYALFRDANIACGAKALQPWNTECLLLRGCCDWNE